MEDKELDGYTEEEFLAMLELMGVGTLYRMTGKLLGQMAGADTPSKRLEVVNIYRNAIEGHKLLGEKHGW